MMVDQYDLSLVFVSAQDLPNADFFGKSDPYLVVNFNGKAQFKSKVVDDDLNPVWNEHLRVANVPDGTYINIHVYDKDVGTEDDLLGIYPYRFSPKIDQGNWCTEWEERLPLSNGSKRKGSVLVKFSCTRSRFSGPLRLTGPVRWRRHTCGITGLITRAAVDHYTYKLFLLNIREIFEGHKIGWNRSYPAAQKIFDNKLLGVSVGRSTINAQHQSMYCPDANTVHGVCNTAKDFYEMMGYGLRNGQHRYFTYVIMEDSMRFSETGAAFFKDMTSKHAMHSSASEEVYYAGEFMIAPSSRNPLGYMLVIDNNSGTYAPPKEKLPLVACLFMSSFPDMEVVTLDYKADAEEMAKYHAMCPSRSVNNV